MSMTYATLKEQLLQYLNRQSDDDTINQIPNFISQAEQRICRESKNIGLESYVVGTFIPTVSVYQKPARWRRSLSFNYGSGVGNNVRNQIRLRAYEYLRDYWPDSTKTDKPLYYSDYGYSNFLVAPTPDQEYPFELCYLELPEQLTEQNQTNWITNYAPDLLLYASLLEAIPFLKNDERVQVWLDYYKRALDSINSQDDARKTDRASDRSSD
jgi:hypothetical protein